jgi:hypothetical protein
MTRAARLPHRAPLRPRRDDKDGASRRVLVLSHRAGEWIGLDLATGAFVRVQHDEEATSGTEEPGFAATKDATGAKPAGDTARDVRPFDVVEIWPAPAVDPPDPARPEALRLAKPPQREGRTRRRAVRRFLSSVAVYERPGAVLLGTRGPSVAYVDLNSSLPSVEIVALGRRRVTVRAEEAGLRAAFSFGGVGLSFPLDPSAPARLGLRPAGREQFEVGAFRPEFVLLGLGEVEHGHVRKLVLDLLPGGVARRERRLRRR